MIARIFNVGDGCLCLLNNNVFERRRQPQGSRLFEFLVSGFAPGDGGGGGTQMKGVGMLVVSLRGVNFGFWSHLWCCGQTAIIFSHEGLV